MEKTVKRLSWLILLVVPSLLWAQDAPEPAGDGDVAPVTATDDPAGGEEPKAVDVPVNQPEKGDPDDGMPDLDEDDKLGDLVGALGCCGSWSVIPVIILIIFLRRRANAKKRTETLSGLASELSLEFHPDGNEELQLQLAGFPLLNKGRKGQLTNICAGGTDELRLWICDYRFITGYGKNRRVHRQTVVAMKSDLLKLPEFRMRPERMFDRVGQMLGLQDIDFEDHLQFSQQFVLQSDMAEATRDFFDTGLLDFFAERPGCSFETRSGSFIVYRPRGIVTPDKFQAFFEDGFRYYTALRERLERN